MGARLASASRGRTSDERGPSSVWVSDVPRPPSWLVCPTCAAPPMASGVLVVRLARLLRCAANKSRPRSRRTNATRPTPYNQRRVSSTSRDRRFTGRCSPSSRLVARTPPASPLALARASFRSFGSASATPAAACPTRRQTNQPTNTNQQPANDRRQPTTSHRAPPRRSSSVQARASRRRRS